MNIRTKVALFTSSFLIITMIVLATVSVINIQRQGEAEIQAYRAEAVQDVKNHLKDLVDLAYSTIEQNYERLSDTTYLSSIYKDKLNNIIDGGETILRRYQARVRAGSITLEEAKVRAAREIGELRFDGGSGYIWINDLGKPYPRMVMHPTIPSLNNQILNSSDFNNAQGIEKNLFVAFVDETEDKSEGYVDYLWPKPTPQGLTEEVPKLSYVRRYEEWGWILGTGIYIDDAQTEIETRIKDTVKTMFYDEGEGYFWINDDTGPFPTMVMHPTIPALDGQVLDDPQYNNALGRGENLFAAFLQVTESDETGNAGYVDYLWPKPTPQGLTEETEKLSYVRLHKPLGWIIGSGVYIDNIDKQVAEARENISDQVMRLIIGTLTVSLFFLAIAVVAAYFFAGNLASPIEKLTNLANEISRGKNLNAEVPEASRKDEIGALAKSIDRMRTSVQIMMQRMRSRD
jgi:methyl-accepting chemotaxis protein